MNRDRCFAGRAFKGFCGYKQEESRGTFVTLSWAHEGDILGAILPRFLANFTFSCMAAYSARGDC
jgi:hypothetical protein